MKLYFKFLYEGNENFKVISGDSLNYSFMEQETVSVRRLIFSRDVPLNGPREKIFDSLLGDIDLLQTIQVCANDETNVIIEYKGSEFKNLTYNFGLEQGNKQRFIETIEIYVNKGILVNNEESLEETRG